MVVCLPYAASNVFIFHICCRRDVVRCVGVVIRVRERLISAYYEHEVTPPTPSRACDYGRIVSVGERYRWRSDG